MILQTLTAEKVQEQISTIEEQRRTLVGQAERQLSAIDGQLATLRWLLAEEKKPDETPA